MNSKQNKQSKANKRNKTKQNKKTLYSRVLRLFTDPVTWNAGALGNVEYPFIAIAPRSTLARRGSTW